MKKLISVLLVLVMVLSLGTTAFAAEATELVTGAYSITIRNSDEMHTYEAYQIFTGTLHDGILSNIQWGSSVVNAEELGDAADVAARLDESYTGDDALGIADLTAMIELGAAAGTSTYNATENVHVINGLVAGYYLVKDQDKSLDNTGHSYTEYIMKVVANVVVEPKSDAPEVQKKVQDKSDSINSTPSDWQDSADHDIGDTVDFQLKATLASNVETYKTYKVVFHDTQSAGLTFEQSSVKVYVDGKLVEGGYEVIVNPADGHTFDIVIDNAKQIGATNNSVIIVEYQAILDEDAVVGSAGNPNTVYLEFSNNPNWDGEGEEEETGITPEDTVIVFTYKTIINKVDGKNKPLAGAEFKLEKYDYATSTWNEIAVVKNDEGTTFTFTGLDDGKYCLTETKTPEGYNTIDTVYFEVTASHDILSDHPALNSLNGNVTTGELTMTVDKAAGSLSADVVNQAGAVLPETGGMGTTMFYVIGGLLAAAAVVLLITKKRMHDAA